MSPGLQTHLRNLAPFAVLAVLILATGYANDRRSCERQIPVRHALRAAADFWDQHGRHDLARRLKRDVKPLNCSAFLPE